MVEIIRDGYGFRYYFNAGLNRETCQVDEEGIEVFEQDSTGDWHLIATIPTSNTIQDIQDMTDIEFNNFLAENCII